MVLRQIADRAAGFRFARIAAEDHGAARGLMRTREQHLDESGLARAVRSEQPVGGSDRHAQRDVVDGAQFTAGERAAENLGQSFGFDGVFTDTL